MLVYLIQGITLGVTAAVQPGPFVAYLIGQALKLGWRRALPAVLAPLISDGPIVAVILLVLTRFPAGFLRFVQIAGGLFVIYLAWKSYLSWRDFQPAQIDLDNGARQSVLQAAAMNFLSPGPYLFWSLAAGPTLIRGWNEAPIRGTAFVGGFYLAMLSGLVTLVILFGSARRLGPRVNRALLGLSALALAVFGVYQLVSGVIV